MCDAEWIEDAGLHRHLAADLIGGLRRDDEADIASDLHCGSPKAWAALHHFIAGKKRAAQVFHLRRCFGPASADVLAYQLGHFEHVDDGLAAENLLQLVVDRKSVVSGKSVSVLVDLGVS